MRRTSVTWGGKDAALSSNGPASIDRLATHIGKLLRHPAYRRESVVSPLLRRHLPYDAGYAWNDEPALRKRLGAAGLDEASLDHLIRNVQAEFTRLRRPSDA